MHLLVLAVAKLELSSLFSSFRPYSPEPLFLVLHSFFCLLFSFLSILSFFLISNSIILFSIPHSSPIFSFCLLPSLLWLLISPSLLPYPLPPSCHFSLLHLQFILAFFPLFSYPAFFPSSPFFLLLSLPPLLHRREYGRNAWPTQHLMHYVGARLKGHSRPAVCAMLHNSKESETCRARPRRIHSWAAWEQVIMGRRWRPFPSLWDLLWGADPFSRKRGWMWTPVSASCKKYLRTVLMNFKHNKTYTHK